jgi:hypothetical protein
MASLGFSFACSGRQLIEIDHLSASRLQFRGDSFWLGLSVPAQDWSLSAEGVSMA